MRRIAGFAILFSAVTLTAQMPAPRPAPPVETRRPEILGTRGIVAAGRHYSVSAGARILRQGGNAVDAGVASVLAAAVCEISHFGFGGEAPTMIYDARKGEIIVINGQGPAPRAATPALFAARGWVPGNGPLGATIPAMLDAMAIALETKGTMRLEQVLQPAIELADGFPMYAFLRATPSSGWLLGGAFVAGDTGVPLSNRMTVFDLDPLSPNVLAGGKRPRTTLTPTLVMKDGKPFLAISTPGGDSQDQQILNVLLEMIVFGKGIQEAIEAPRVNSRHPFGSFDSHLSDPGVLEIEDRVPVDVRDALTARGHKLKVLQSAVSVFKDAP